MIINDDMGALTASRPAWARGLKRSSIAEPLGRSRRAPRGRVD